MAAGRALANTWRHARWLLNCILQQLHCHFCQKPIFDKPLEGRDWLRLQRLVTVHHKDGVHTNDWPDNWGVAHVRCHRRWHVQNRDPEPASEAEAECTEQTG